jgi:hypothetical protein
MAPGKRPPPLATLAAILDRGSKIPDPRFGKSMGFHNPNQRLEQQQSAGPRRRSNSAPGCASKHGVDLHFNIPHTVTRVRPLSRAKNSILNIEIFDNST